MIVVVLLLYSRLDDDYIICPFFNKNSEVDNDTRRLFIDNQVTGHLSQCALSHHVDIGVRGLFY